MTQPHRASLLQPVNYAHTHTYGDNSALFRSGQPKFFTQKFFAKKMATKTSFLASCNMGDEESQAQAGFDYWIELFPRQRSTTQRSTLHHWAASQAAAKKPTTSID